MDMLAGLAGGMGGGGGASGLLMAPEAERMVESLRTFTIDEVGSRGWMKQREALERLNVQAHHNAVNNTDEFVKEFLISHDKILVLVHELLVVEAWKERVYPHFAKIDPNAMDAGLTNSQVYLAHYCEATLVNLIEVSFFHQDACEAAGDDALLELCDYCARKLVYLNDGRAAEDAQLLSRAKRERKSAKELLNARAGDEFAEKEAEVRFGTATCALTVLRYLTDYINDVPLCVMARLLDTHDAQMLLVPLLEERPWLRRVPGKGGGRDVNEVFADGRWTEQPREDRLQLTKCDAQTWLALNNLTVDAKCRAKYRYDDHRKSTMSRLKRFFNDILFDQLPVLKDLQRVTDEILLNAAPASHEVTQGRLILEQVPETRTALLRRSEKEWIDCAKAQLSSHFADTPEARQAAMSRFEDMSKMFEFMCEMEDKERASKAKPKPDAPPPRDTVRVEFSRKASDGEYYLWHRYDIKFDENKPMKEIVISGEGDAKIRGDQHRLRQPEPSGEPTGAPLSDAQRKAREDAHRASPLTPVPHDGKLTATYGTNRAEVLLDLPTVGRIKADIAGGNSASEEAEAASKLDDIPAGVWVTCGQVARDGFALQLKLKRTAGVHEAWRCAKTGVYYVYEPGGGALTARTGDAKPGGENGKKIPKGFFDSPKADKDPPKEVIEHPKEERTMDVSGQKEAAREAAKKAEVAAAREKEARAFIAAKKTEALAKAQAAMEVTQKAQAGETKTRHGAKAAGDSGKSSDSDEDPLYDLD